MSTAITSCKECGSEDLSWHTHNRIRTDVQQGRLNTSDVTCVFVLGCNECSETLAVVSADAVAASMSADLLKLAKLDVASKPPRPPQAITDWGALGYVKGATVRQHLFGSNYEDAVITCVHQNGALDVEICGVPYGWSASRCTVVSKDRPA